MQASLKVSPRLGIVDVGPSEGVDQSWGYNDAETTSFVTRPRLTHRPAVVQAGPSSSLILPVGPLRYLHPPTNNGGAGNSLNSSGDHLDRGSKNPNPDRSQGDSDSTRLVTNHWSPRPNGSCPATMDKLAATFTSQTVAIGQRVPLVPAE